MDGSGCEPEKIFPTDRPPAKQSVRPSDRRSAQNRVKISVTRSNPLSVGTAHFVELLLFSNSLHVVPFPGSSSTSPKLKSSLHLKQTMEGGSGKTMAPFNLRKYPIFVLSGAPTEDRKRRRRQRSDQPTFDTNGYTHKIGNKFEELPEETDTRQQSKTYRDPHTSHFFRMVFNLCESECETD